MRVPHGSLRWLNRRRILFFFLAAGWIPLAQPLLSMLLWPHRTESVLDTVLWMGLSYFVAGSQGRAQALLRLALAYVVLSASILLEFVVAFGAGAASWIGLTAALCVAIALVFLVLPVLSQFVLVHFALKVGRPESAQGQDRLVVVGGLWAAVLTLIPALTSCCLTHGWGMEPSATTTLATAGAVGLAAGAAVVRMRARARWLRMVAAGEEPRWRIVPLDEIPEAQRIRLQRTQVEGDAAEALVYLDEETEAPYREAPHRIPVALADDVGERP
jgi:hypothetical protein